MKDSTPHHIPARHLDTTQDLMTDEPLDMDTAPAMRERKYVKEKLLLDVTPRLRGTKRKAEETFPLDSPPVIKRSNTQVGGPLFPIEDMSTEWFPEDAKPSPKTHVESASDRLMKYMSEEQKKTWLAKPDGQRMMDLDMQNDKDDPDYGEPVATARKPVGHFIFKDNLTGPNNQMVSWDTAVDQGPLAMISWEHDWEVSNADEPEQLVQADEKYIKSLDLLREHGEISAWQHRIAKTAIRYGGQVYYAWIRAGRNPTYREERSEAMREFYRKTPGRSPGAVRKDLRKRERDEDDAVD